MKKLYSSLLLLVLTLSFVQFSYASQTTNAKKETGYISLNASEVKELEPTIANITFAVENTANDAQKAALENNLISNKIIDALKSITTEKTDTIQTTNFSVRPVYYTSSGKRVIKNYTAVNSVTVETKDITKVAKLIDIAIQNGANRVNGLYYFIENEKQICNSFYPEIIKNLKLQATTLAHAAGTSLDGLKHMNVSCGSDTMVSNGRFYAKGVAMDSTAAESYGTPVEAGKIKIRVHVNADFYVK